MAGKKEITDIKEEMQTEEDVESENRPLTFSDYINFTESYTSLILGIVVVIIASILLISFFKNRHIGNFPRQDISATSTVNTEKLKNASPSAAISGEIAQKPSDTPIPLVTPTSTITPSPTIIPTKIVSPTTKPTVTPVPAKVIIKPTQAIPATYTVARGDSLWSIAEKIYNDGYKWVDIAKANNLSDPSLIYSDLKLTLPQEVPSTNVAQTPQTQMNAPGVITGATYVIKHGDDLWDIAVRAYGDGYKWVDIARANNLTNPGLIHADNTLQIPR